MIFLQVSTEWPLVVSIIGLIAVIIGGVWVLSYSINKKIDRETFEKHIEDNNEDFEKAHDYARGKVSLALFETEREQSRMIIAAMKMDIENAKQRNDEMIKMMGDMNAKMGVINTNIDWIRKNIKCD